jgi:hypothetical protein
MRLPARPVLVALLAILLFAVGRPAEADIIGVGSLKFYVSTDTHNYSGWTTVGSFWPDGGSWTQYIPSGTSLSGPAPGPTTYSLPQNSSAAFSWAFAPHTGGGFDLELVQTAVVSRSDLTQSVVGWNMQQDLFLWWLRPTSTFIDVTVTLQAEYTVTSLGGDGGAITPSWSFSPNFGYISQTAPGAPLWVPIYPGPGCVFPAMQRNGAFPGYPVTDSWTCTMTLWVIPTATYGLDLNIGMSAQAYWASQPPPTDTVPEPASLVLLASGLAGVVSAVRRRR